ncbi:tripartite tricarboxylate transporter substrate binding protein [Halomonas sp. McH1-25]|uniref:Bug family tripartite tricarboxylate transporter substrate binding protein n=1 Tax=unclassified Halomonas TaxID=2609666 RepID=UPI001EF45AC1|nr:MULTISPECIES: tripartite tricarboxylate transporter substrate-binding protein [unclassified Halomonas]MCG7601524.1 tripartite tricarboxylate transporter substrate binding protein [Halomonas sp. McH1-25]MCP1343925.1 tripartite tricarboxylate transporter substrate-binding protein [Halomonas sp. FL8]MCP1361540.1 tripartite tricarboxylate transporter substrate-binding protein [Halomonas sp. BBD45]MCP1363985.1 tripartite tricarboxylate transporter substrate-binding protein [Halomonas sp. BBD48]
MKKALLSAAVVASTVAFPFAVSAYEPQGKVECLAPADPGGGWDFTCRSVGRTLEELNLVPGSVQTINMPGASGGVAFAHVISKRAGDEELLVAASTATTTRLAQGQFRGMNADMVNWIGALGADYGIIAVADDSAIENFEDLLGTLKEKPNSVSFAGGSSKGGWDHLKVLMLAKEAGVEGLSRIKYLPFTGGGEAMTQVVGGHIDAFTGDISEAQGFMESGDLRVLAVLADERLPGDLSDIPTAKEQGVDVVGANWRGFYMPADISDDAKQYWIDTLDQLYASDEWQGVMKQNGLIPFDVQGEEFRQFVENQINDIETLSKEVGIIQ